MKVQVFAAAAVAVVLGSAASAATVTNGDFDDGLNGWTVTGDISVVDSSVGVLPSSGSNQALLTSNTVTTDANLETALGAPLGSLDLFSGSANPSGGNVTVGSVLVQTINSVVGQTLSFDYNFLNGEIVNSAFADGAFFYADGTYFLLADVDTPEQLSSATVFSTETGYTTFNYTFTTTGSQTIGFGVFNEQDTLVNSGLLIDNIVGGVAPVPVPAALPLLLTAFGGLAAVRRRRKA
ncbi:MAG: VPLPA-CTERM sorting domain-containing protein [Pseudomonadota bacterium]